MNSLRLTPIAILRKGLGEEDFGFFYIHFPSLNYLITYISIYPHTLIPIYSWPRIEANYPIHLPDFRDSYIQLRCSSLCNRKFQNIFRMNQIQRDLRIFLSKICIFIFFKQVFRVLDFISDFILNNKINLLLFLSSPKFNIFFL